MTCYTFSVTPTFLDSENLKFAMKKINEEENEDFYEEEYLNFEELTSGEEKNILKIFLHFLMYLLLN